MVEKNIILLIDDDDDDKLIFREVVENLDSNYECVFASDGQEGLQLLNSMKKLPSFIFIDLNMPKMNGKQCLTDIKKDKKYKDLPVIIYTTSKLDADIEETRLLGATYFLTKPGLFTDLQEAIRKILSGEYSSKKGKNAEVSQF